MECEEQKFRRLKINDDFARHEKLENTMDILKADAQIACFVEQGLNDNQKKARMALDSTVRASLTIVELVQKKSF